MANVIELIAKWRDEGASAGLANATRSSGLLSTALGVGIGGGLAGAAFVAAGALEKLVTAPLEAARSFGQLVERVDMGNAAFKKFHSAAGEAESDYLNLFHAVGVEGVQAFRDLAAAQREADESWQRMMARLALGAAGPMKGFADTMSQILSPLRFNPAGYAAAREAAQVVDTEFRQMLIKGPEVEAILKRLAEAQAKFTAAKDRDAATFEKRRRQAEASNLGITVTAQRPSMTLGDKSLYKDFSQRPEAGGEGLAGTVYQMREVERIFPEIEMLAGTAGASVANSLVSIAANFNNNMQTIGSAAKAFWNALISDILAALARLALAKFGSWLLGLAIGGPVGAVVSAAGGAFGGTRSSAGSPRMEGASGNTYVFQGINTREMYMEVALRGGSIARANDLVRMRAEVG